MTPEDKAIADRANKIASSVYEPWESAFRLLALGIEEAQREAIAEATRWMPVTERLPPAGQTVLAWRYDLPSETPPIPAFWTGQRWCHAVLHYTLVVDCWQALPPGPLEDTE